jgi:hypothetical protein
MQNQAHTINEINKFFNIDIKLYLEETAQQENMRPETGCPDVPR